MQGWPLCLQLAVLESALAGRLAQIHRYASSCVSGSFTCRRIIALFKMSVACGMSAVNHRERFIWCNLLLVGLCGKTLLKLCIACFFCACVPVGKLAHALRLGVA